MQITTEMREHARREYGRAQGHFLRALQAIDRVEPTGQRSEVLATVGDWDNDRALPISVRTSAVSEAAYEIGQEDMGLLDANAAVRGGWRLIAMEDARRLGWLS